MAEQKTRPPLSLIEAIIPVASLILLVGLSYYLFKDGGADGPNQVGMAVATMIAVFVGWRRGHTLHELSDAAVASVSSGIGAIFILFAVGALIGTWAMSGTLVTMVYYGLKILNPAYFYVSAAAITAAVSVGIGSSWTTAGTVGIGLMGISDAMGLDRAITAGAIVSGAYFGDTVSPLSDSANLAAGAADVDLYAHIRRTGLIAGVALAIALVAFWFAGGATGDVDASYKMAMLDGDFHISLVLFLPLFLVVALALLKVRPFTTIFLGALAGGLLAAIVAPDRVEAFAEADKHVPTGLAQVKGVWEALARGYVSTTGHPVVDQLTTRGGMSSMLTTVWLVIAAFAFGWCRRKDRCAGPLDHSDHPGSEVHRQLGHRSRGLDPGHGHCDGGSVPGDRPAGEDVQARLRGSRPSAGPAVELGRCLGDTDLGADPLEQLRRLSGRDPRRRDLELCAVRRLQRRQSAAGDRRRLRRRRSDAQPRPEGLIGGLSVAARALRRPAGRQASPRRRTAAGRRG